MTYKKFLLSCLVLLLPIPADLLLNRLLAPAISGTVFYIPQLYLLAVHVAGVFVILRDPGHAGRNRRVLTLVLWLLPGLSWFVSLIHWALSYGVEFSPIRWVCAGMGLLLAAIGNYLPKTRPNATVGIRIPWVYTSEENWSATHRLAGRLWLCGGLALLPAALLPQGWIFGVLAADILALTLIPSVFSWRFWRRQQAAGVRLKPLPGAAKWSRAQMATLAAVLALMGVLLFSGDIEFRFREEALGIEADFYSDLTVPYDTIVAVEYREGEYRATRVGGYGSPRLQMGWYESREFGLHTRYTYHDAGAWVVVTTDSGTLVLSGRTPEETRQLYQALLAQA